jgi:ATP-dependent Clp protease adaptor protein ClpS
VRGTDAGVAGRCKPYYAVQVTGGQDKTDGVVKERVKTEKKDPTLYKVVLLNDDYTTMEFVMHVLETLFQKSPAESYRIMMQVHLNGQGIAGVYPWEVAETKVEALTSMARAAEFPLRAAIEEA